MSTAKSTVTHFTPDTYEQHLHPQLKLADQVLPLVKKPKVLGVTLDIHLTITQHCNNIAVIVQQSNNVLKALAGCTWGCDKETLLSTYQAIGRSILSYCKIATAALSGRHHLRTLTGAGSNGHKILR